MAGTAPNYDDVRWPAKDGLRVPTEAGSATLAVSQLVAVNGGGAAAVTLNSTQVNASVLVVTNMGSITSTVSLPAAIPGKAYIFKNSTGSGSACTFKVTGKTGIAVADGSQAVLYCNTTDIARAGADA